MSDTVPADKRYPRIGSMRSVEAFREYFQGFLPELEVDERILTSAESPLAAPIEFDGLRIGNRFTIHPMEGWDGTTDGRPSELTLARWRNFGLSGAKLIWGGEAVAVRADGRANPNQLCYSEAAVQGLSELRTTLLDAHRERFGSTDDLVVGLQLTHSGRFARPDKKTEPKPRVAYRHPILDPRVGADDASVLSDAELGELVECFAKAAKSAHEIGYDFVDIKHCHGYLLHEFLSAHRRPGPYGGSFENRTRLLRELVAAVRAAAPGLEIGIRLSIFDMIPFRPDPAKSSPGAPGPGIPEDYETPYRWGFGVQEDAPTEPELDEGRKLLKLIESLGIRLVNLSGGSPYYNPHMQRPALYPPSDGYQPPEDPTEGVVRHLRICRDLKREFPSLVTIGSALSYLQDYFPQVSQSLVREGWMDSVGLGRMVLSYWDLPADCLEKGELARKKVCRTFSDCTTAPRNGIVSGCYPLDPRYRAMPEAADLRAIKQAKDGS
ncbi:MAG: NADH:flavin oxidoreductase [Planctomycetota bacterium]